MKKKLERTEYVRTKNSLSNGKTYVYKKSLRQKIGGRLFMVVGIGFATYFFYQVGLLIVNLFK